MEDILKQYEEKVIELHDKYQNIIYLGSAEVALVWKRKKKREADLLRARTIKKLHETKLI